MTEPTTTWHGSLDGRMSAVIIDGLIVELRIPATLVDPSEAESLGDLLTDHLNTAYERHIADFLAPTREGDPTLGEVARRAETAVAAAGGIPRPPRMLAGWTSPEPGPGEVSVEWRDAAIAGIRISHQLLAEGSAANVAEAVRKAVNLGPQNLDPELLHLVEHLTKTDVQRELVDVAHRLRDEGRAFL